MKGKFIVFEGIDGSGKSTQIKFLKNYLTERGVTCHITAEPTDSPFGSLIHQCMTGRIETDERTIAAMFAADRLDHLYNKRDGLLDKIESGITVISDRYYLSSYAYQCAQLPMDWVLELNRLSAEALKPDVNIFIDIEPERSLARLKNRPALERYEKLETMKKIRSSYFDIFSKLKEERVEIVRSDEDVNVTRENIRKIADGLFGFRV